MLDEFKRVPRSVAVYNAELNFQLISYEKLNGKKILERGETNVARVSRFIIRTGRNHISKEIKEFCSSNRKRKKKNRELGTFELRRYIGLAFYVSQIHRSRESLNQTIHGTYGMLSK